MTTGLLITENVKFQSIARTPGYRKVYIDDFLLISENVKFQNSAKTPRYREVYNADCFTSDSEFKDSLCEDTQIQESTH